MTAAAPETFVPEMLERYGETLRIAMRGYLPEGGPGREVFAAARDYPERRGRMMRGSLAVAATRALGGDTLAGARVGVALELLHNAFLVHDDIEDESDERRGRPTLHRAFGTPMAINAGDALTVLSLRPLMDCRDILGAQVVGILVEELQHMALETVTGQGIELGWRRANTFDLQEQDYLEMVLKKTCWYSMIFPLRAAAIIARRSRIERDAFVEFGFFLGAAFQIEDDVLNLVGDHARYGKELSGDLLEGKRTLILIRLLASAEPADRLRACRFLSAPREQREPAEVGWMLETMQRYGCIAYATEFAHGLAGAARHEFERAFAGVPESDDLRFVGLLAQWVLGRD